MYPDVSPLTAQSRLARDLLAFCRVGPTIRPGGQDYVRTSTRSSAVRDA